MKQRKNKRFWSLVLSLAMMLALAPAALAASRFTDVPETAWYYKDVESAVAQGLVTGTSATTYSPDKNLTYAEAVKLAACMHRKVTTGSTEFPSGSPWYQPYVDYAKANKIITKNYDWSQNATRAGYMEIFAGAIPETGLLAGYGALAQINQVDDNAIPDVSMSHPQAAGIYKLYRAGILQGSDSAHNCNPSSAIRRSEVATILTRMMDAGRRIRFELAASGSGLKVTTQPADAIAVSGDRVSFAVAVSGGKGPFTYVWYQSADGTNWTKLINDSNCSGVAAATLTVKAGDITANRLYRCEITDAAGGKAVSNAAKLTLGASTLKITAQPQSVAAAEDEWVTFTVAVSGGKTPYTYRWEMKDENMADFSPLPLNNPGYVKNADTASVGIRADSTDWNYNNQYRCKVTDAAGSIIYSDSASILEDRSDTGSTGDTGAKSDLRIIGQPQNMVAEEGERATATVTIDGGKGPFTYKWMYSADGVSWSAVPNDSVFSGVATKTLTVKADGWAELFQYRCEITDAARAKVESNIITFRRDFPFSFTEQPQGSTVREGKSASLTVRIQYGKDPVAFRWQVLKGGVWTDLALGTDYTVEDHSDMSTLTIRKVTINNLNNNYRCVATDCIGQEIVSNTAKINLYRQ